MRGARGWTVPGGWTPPGEASARGGPCAAIVCWCRTRPKHTKSATSYFTWWCYCSAADTRRAWSGGSPACGLWAGYIFLLTYLRGVGLRLVDYLLYEDVQDVVSLHVNVPARVVVDERELIQRHWEQYVYKVEYDFNLESWWVQIRLLCILVARPAGAAGARWSPKRYRGAIWCCSAGRRTFSGLCFRRWTSFAWAPTACADHSWSHWTSRWPAASTWQAPFQYWTLLI